MHGVTLASGRVIPELTLHYRTLDMPTHDETGLITNAVLLLGDATDFLADSPAEVLFASGQPLDASQYFLIFPDLIDDLTGPGELVQLQYRLVLEHLGINHLRLIFGNGEAGRQAWMWASTHPYFVDALVVVDCLASDAGQLQPADRDQLAAAPGNIRANTVAIFDEDELTPSRRVLLQNDIARMKNGRYLIYRNDRTGASAGANSMVRKWKMILPELLESAAGQ